MAISGGLQTLRHDTDHEHVFRQESFFQYLFGVKVLSAGATPSTVPDAAFGFVQEPDCMGALALPSGNATLFIPRLPKEYAVWQGRIWPPEHFLETYGVEVLFWGGKLDHFGVAQIHFRKYAM